MSITKIAKESPATKKRKLSHSSAMNASNRNGSVPMATTGPGQAFSMDSLTKEMLAEVRPNYETQKSRVEATLQKVIDIVKNIAPRPPVSAVEAEKSLRKSSGVVIPFPEPRPGKETQYMFEYQKPEYVGLVGSASSNLYLKGPRTLDVAVMMPSGLFQVKDYLNYRAFHKRAFYVACIADGITNAADDEFGLSYEYQDDILSLPVLIISSTKKSSVDFIRSKSRIRLLVTLPEGAIPMDKTLPAKNCVRPPGGAAAEDKLEATPFYNSCVRATTSVQVYQNLIAKSSEKCSAFADACRLGRTWLRQRDMGSPMPRGGFGPCEWTIVCALLFRTGGHKGRPMLSVRFSSLQIFKVMLHFLAESDLTDPAAIDAEALSPTKSHSPIFYDNATGINVLFKMTPWSYQALKAMAAQSVAAVNGNSSGSFESTFISRVDQPHLRFDESYSIDISSFPIAVSDGTGQNAILLKIYNALLRGFGNRVTRFEIGSSSTKSWKLSKSAPKNTTESSSVTIHLLLNAEAVTRLVDRGPSAEDPDEAAEFRKFWGSKAELRRFKDGTICESLIWTDGDPLTLQILQHLLLHQFGVSAKSITSISNYNHVELEILPRPALNLTATDTLRLAHKTYQDLSNTLLQIKDLPLRIKATSPLDAVLCSSSLDLSFSHPMNMLIEFEDSPRWPDTVAAIEHTKTAFLVKLAEILDESHPHLTTRVGVENQGRSRTANEKYSEYFFNRAFLDIIYPSSGSGIPKIAFRVRIRNSRTEHLLQSAIQTVSHSNKSQRDLLNCALHQQTLQIHLATHTLAIRTLCSTYPILSPTNRLLKKWTESHLLSRQIPSQLIDLVAVAALPIPQTNEIPGTATTGFLRALALLSKWDWVNEPLLLSLDPSKSGKLGRDKGDRIRATFRAWRERDPNMQRVAVCVGTDADETGCVWTQQWQTVKSGLVFREGQGVSGVIMRRWCRLAEHAVSVVDGWHKHIDRGTEDDDTTVGDRWNWKSLFSSPLGDYDFIIHLKRKHKKMRADETKFKNLELAATGMLGVDDESLGFDPEQLYLDDLEVAFSSAALFFYDASGGGSVIAGLWRPDVLGRRKQVVKDGQVGTGVGFSYPIMPVSGEGEAEVVINQASVLSQIAQMGAGIVERVETVKDFVV